MRAGPLRHRVTIQAPLSASQSATGREVPTWGDVYTCWASIAPLTGREYFVAQQTQMELTHEVTLRFTTAISLRPKMRLAYGTRLFDIEVIRHLGERRQEVRLICRELVGAPAA